MTPLHVADQPDAWAIVDEVLAELEQARAKFGPIASAHEGWGVIAEEWRELQQAIHENDHDAMRREALQLGAMAARFVLDVVPRPASS